MKDLFANFSSNFAREGEEISWMLAFAYKHLHVCVYRNMLK